LSKKKTTFISILAKRFFSSFRGDHIEQHTAELNRMEGIISPQHLEKNPFVTSLRINRYVVKMSRYGFELLLSFLQDNKFMMLLRIINQFINLHVVKEGVEPSDESIRGNLGIPENQISTMNEQPVKLGKPEMDPLISQEIERQLKDQVYLQFFLFFFLVFWFFGFLFKKIGQRFPLK